MLNCDVRDWVPWTAVTSGANTGAPKYGRLENSLELILGPSLALSSSHAYLACRAAARERTPNLLCERRAAARRSERATRIEHPNQQLENPCATKPRSVSYKIASGNE